MQPEKNKVIEAILVSAQRIMDTMPDEGKAGFAGFHASSDLFGGNSPFDSLNLVAFIVELEEELQKRFGIGVALADERVLAQPTNPFRSVVNLADYVGLLLSER